MAISKKTREAIYHKYNGHCAYCGRAIAYKDMQVDHLRPRRAYNAEDEGTDDMSNLMPSCRMCNHYKRANTLETFRQYIQEIPKKLRENYIYKVGLAYRNVIEMEKPIVFYFEQLQLPHTGFHCGTCKYDFDLDNVEPCIDCDNGSRWEEKGGGYEE